MLIPILVLISVASFIVIELPPGDWVSNYINNLRTSGIELEESEADRLTAMYGFDQPSYVRYARWMQGIVTRGDFGWSFQWGKPVNDILRDRLPYTLIISFAALIVSWLIAIPVGIYSATHPYSIVDYIATILAFVWVATPGFLLAFVSAWLVFRYLDFSPLGLNSSEFLDAPWDRAKLIDRIKHLILPVLIIGLSGTGSTIRVMRANLLDELKKQYVTTARAKGVNSTIGWLLPALFSGEVIISVVLSIPTLGPTLLRATLAQDMYLVGSIVLILSTLTVVGTLISDIYLAWSDPRIRFESTSK